MERKVPAEDDAKRARRVARNARALIEVIWQAGMQGRGEGDDLPIREIASRGDADEVEARVRGLRGNRTARWGYCEGKERVGDRPRSGRDERWAWRKQKRTKWEGNRSRICVEIVGGVVSGFS